MKNILIALLLIAVILLACDPMQVLTIEAPKDNKASVILYVRKGIFPGKYFEPEYGYGFKPDSLGKITIQVPDSLHNPYFFISYGIGDWQYHEVLSIANNIDSIVFINSRRRRVLKGDDDIIPYLWKRLRGFPFKNRIYIKAK